MPSFIPKYDSILFGELHKVSTLLPPDEREDSFRSILKVAGVITIIHFVLLKAVISWRSGRDKEGKKTADIESSLAAWTMSYQIMNCLVNLTLGCAGIYHTIHTPWNENTSEKIIGYGHVKLFAIGQVGYQLWALPIGLFFVGELKSMIMHHVAVICVGSVSAFLHCGFRYYNPYFFGLIEISSVPLSVMNYFKKNKHLIEAYPNAYRTVRLVFGVTFLIVRVILWTPFFWDFITNAMMLLYSSENMTTKAILACFNLSALVLTMLQYFWASKIIVSIVGTARPKQKQV